MTILFYIIILYVLQHITLIIEEGDTELKYYQKFQNEKQRFV